MYSESNMMRGEPQGYVPSMNLDNHIEHAQTLTATVGEMAAMLQISLPTAYELTKQKGFPCFHVGRKILVNRQGLQEWIDSQCQGGQ